MMRMLRAVGLALLAILVLGAMAAAGASAEFNAEIDLGVEKGGVLGQLDGTVTFTRQGRGVTCTEAEFLADAEDGDTEITTKEAEFAECEAPAIKGAATVKMNKCHLYFNLTADSEDAFTALAGLKCPEGGSATIAVFSSSAENHNTPLCEYALPEQENLTTIGLSNLGPEGNTKKDWVRAHVNLGKIASTRTVGSLLACGSLNDEEGTLEGTFKLKGVNSSKEDVGLKVITDI